MSDLFNLTGKVAIVMGGKKKGTVPNVIREPGCHS